MMETNMLFLGKVNPNMVILARESRGVTQKELAEKMCIKQGTLSKIENGLQNVSEELLDILSAELAYPVSFFFQQNQLYNPNLVHYRKRTVFTKKDLAKADATMNISKINLEKLLNSVDIPDLQLPKWEVDEHGSPEKCAAYLREYWRLPKGRIENITKLVEDKGILVVPIDFDSPKMDGLNIFTDTNHPIIFYNRNIPTDRQRLTIAHELGHILLHLGQPIAENRDVEAEAYAFAAEFLMPAAEIKSHLGKVDIARLADLKRYWKVSMAALIIRAKTLRLITDNQYRYLWQQMSALGYRTKEPKELDAAPEPPILLKELVDAHLNDLGYSEEELAQLLSLQLEDFKSRYQDNEVVRPKLKITR
ncbi:ImmA/IrrE family metallo-endopeptidase [Rufibacter immobilis]|uniref:ImmA/IrrE family metallo-endopeptidase n=1 Tax=Rufibacter immobilis TaxID=1348778 RepID=A0A3M9N2Z3_9BACT|nr:XRE family transcriptional regulator [Rufibacter immobilis]RNI31765.1 ImmA/IrrE family metallo-endopeptidase [Rufibacter immobilis]